MNDYLCLTLVANPGESEAAFASRLTAFWTHLLRTQKETYEAVLGEAGVGRRVSLATGWDWIFLQARSKRLLSLRKALT